MKRKIYCLLLAAGLLFWANPAYAGVRTPQVWQDTDANSGRSWVSGGREQSAYLVCQSAAERALPNDAGQGRGAPDGEPPDDWVAVSRSGTATVVQRAAGERMISFVGGVDSKFGLPHRLAAATPAAVQRVSEGGTVSSGDGLEKSSATAGNLEQDGTAAVKDKPKQGVVTAGEELVVTAGEELVVTAGEELVVTAEEKLVVTDGEEQAVTSGADLAVTAGEELGSGGAVVTDMAGDVTAEAQELAAELDLGPIESYLGQVEQAASEILGVGGVEEMWQKAKAGELSFHPKEIVQGILGLFFQEVLNNGRLLAQLALLAIASALLCQLQTGFASQGVASLSRGVIYTALLGIALQSFISLGNSAYQAVDTMSGLLYAMAPLLFTLLGAMGAVSTVALFHPAFLFLLGIGLNVIKTLVLPGVYCSAVFHVVSYISPKFNVKQLAKLCRDVSIGLMTIMLTLFTAALGITGLAGSAINGLTVKAAKTAAGLFVPVVGRTLADTMDTVLSTSLVLKNTIGLFGVIAIFLVCAVPAVKILVVSLLYRLTGALIEPLGDGELARALSSLGGVLTTLFAVVAASGLLFFFLLSIIIGMGNITMMMR